MSISGGRVGTMIVSGAAALVVFGGAHAIEQAGVAAQDARGTSTDQTLSPVESLEEVVITAQKRTERLQDVPVSAAVVNSSSLATSNVSDISDLNRLIPSININGTISGRAPMGMRGISSVSDQQAVGVPSGVAVMVDGIPIPSDSASANQIEDLQSVEVLKGPQATLGGRSAAAGVINYRTYDPTDHFVGSISGTGTTDHEWRGNLRLSGPISDELAYSLSAYDSNRYYPVTNLHYGTDASQRDWGVRAKIQWSITSDISAKLAYHHASVDQNGFNFVYTYLTPGSQLLGALPQSLLIEPVKPGWTNLDYDSPVSTAGHSQEDNDWQLDLTFNLASGYTLTSTSAFQHENRQQIQDLFATGEYFFNFLITGGDPESCAAPAPCFNDTQYQAEKISQKSEEIKLVSPADQRFSYVSGLFYSSTDIKMNYQRGFLPAALNLPNVEPTTDTYDIYGRGTFKFTDTNALILGLRYNYDKLRYVYDEQQYVVSFPTNVYGPLYSTGSSASSAVVGDLTFQHQIRPNVMTYASYARGYSPEVYNTAAALTSESELEPVGQEHIDAFEVGTKGSYFGQRLTLNLALFDTRYHNYQINSYLLIPGSVSGILNINAEGAAETRGGELDVSWRPSLSTTLSMNAAYIDAKFTSWQNAPCVPYYPTGVTGGTTNCSFTSGAGFVQDMSGKPMPNAPHWKLFFDAQQQIALGSLPFHLLAGANWSYRTAAEMLADANPAGIMGAFGILNLSLGASANDGQWSVSLFCNNVLDKVYYQDVEDFWSGPWLNPSTGTATSTIIAQPARDAKRYGGIRFSVVL